MQMDSGIEDRKSNTLIEARKRLASIQGPSITFKRARQSTGDNTAGVSNTGTTSTANIGCQASCVDSDSRAFQQLDPLTSPYGRCPNVSERYKKMGRIGEGTYGIVYKGIDQETHEVVAIKRCLPHHEASDGFPITTLREIQLLREIALDASPVARDNIVALKEVAVGSKSSSVFLVFEYVDFELAKLLDEHYSKYSISPFRLAETKCLARQLFSALEFLHEKCIIHRDLKLSNLLYDKDRGLLKLADFGLARKIDRHAEKRDQSTSRSRRFSFLPSTPPNQNLTPKVVSLWYRPPELLLNCESYTMAIDMWGAGCILAELILGRPIFRGKNDLDQLGQIVKVLGSPTLYDWPELSEMPLVKNGSVEDLPFTLEGSDRKYQSQSYHISCSCKLLDTFSDLSAVGIETLKKLLMFNPAKRWTAKETCGCSWFQEYPSATNCAFMPKFENKL